MAHKIDQWNLPDADKPSVKERVSSFWLQTVPKITGKFGFSLMLGRKEVFVGVAVADVEMEKVVKRVKEKRPPKVFRKARVVPIQFGS